MVRNAGIVLCNNYIQILFERLGIMTDGGFNDTSAQLDAILYLQYVVTGLSSSEDSLLSLNKLLCGVAISQSAKDSITILESQKNLIEGLINAMIGYWPAIGSSSINGFRGNWLVRDGLLLEHEANWELTVDKRPYDLLIDKSPFSFSIIKYPWMPKPLHVNWPL